ncbi:uncharacterized protein ACA1_067740 [Acanthamoeba castellanii str. Neff]|uniref:Uncharacterized protein n=1 Tax=Acanthamoeba castellanii (strain ATCC 30010 / Neff) TaxID=1257118 RepID=L8HDD7_ACACF|nr:uncharacterized protein ACA1_067740 [Acanthamoeba castellanii str. Neff]ELR23190.1 hypothetical protein ACA1_067740 [Acanthamoeba castellanii str. Neff]
MLQRCRGKLNKKGNAQAILHIQKAASITVLAQLVAPPMMPDYLARGSYGGKLTGLSASHQSAFTQRSLESAAYEHDLMPLGAVHAQRSSEFSAASASFLGGRAKPGIPIGGFVSTLGRVCFVYGRCYEYLRARGCTNLCQTHRCLWRIIRDAKRCHDRLRAYYPRLVPVFDRTIDIAIQRSRWDAASDPTICDGEIPIEGYSFKTVPLAVLCRGSPLCLSRPLDLV